MDKALKVLLDLRPALDGYSGIPQETRLLFRGLQGLPGVQMLGLIHSSNLVVEAGLPLKHGQIDPRTPAAEQFDRLSKVVASLQQGPAAHRWEHRRKRALQLTGPAAAALSGLFGLRTRLTGFKADHFKDYVWRAMFAKSLPVEDFDAVTGADYRVLRWPWSMMNAVGVGSAAFGHACYPRLDTRGIDVLITETPFPGRVSKGTQLVVRYHDAIPLLMPHTIKDRGYHRAMHFHALKRNADDGAWFACVSEATRQDLLSVMPMLESRAVTVPNMISHHFMPERALSVRVPEIIWSRKNRGTPHEGGNPVARQDVTRGSLSYLLMVSTLEPRKNHLALLDAWELLRTQGFSRLNLVVVGSLGWEHESIMRRFAPWMGRGLLHLLEAVPAEDLRLLYCHAKVTVCPSFGEGFDFAGVEAMRSGGVVAASDLRVHRGVYGDAAEYFNPYSAQEMARVIASLIEPEAEPRRERLRAAGSVVSAKYLPEQVLPQWHRFLQRVITAPPAA